MELQKYKNIKGIDEFFKCFPGKPWHYFHDVLEFRRYIRFDYEEWIDRTYLDIICLEDLGYEAKYKIEDFEENSICIYCKELEISVINPDQFIYT